MKQAWTSPPAKTPDLAGVLSFFLLLFFAGRFSCCGWLQLNVEVHKPKGSRHKEIAKWQQGTQKLRTHNHLDSRQLDSPTIIMGRHNWYLTNYARVWQKRPGYPQLRLPRWLSPDLSTARTRFGQIHCTRHQHTVLYSSAFSTLV